MRVNYTLNYELNKYLLLWGSESSVKVSVEEAYITALMSCLMATGVDAGRDEEEK